MSTIPAEILRNIFQKLDNEIGFFETMLQCALVCRSWSLPAMHLGYNTVEIKHSAQLKKLVRISQNTTTDYFRFVKTISCDYLNASLNSDEDLYTFAELFPHLEHIQTSRSSYGLFENLEDLLRKDRFNHLRTIPPPDEIHQYKSYTSCALSCQGRIESILLWLEPNKLSFEPDSFHHNILFRDLQQFKSLKNIKIKKRHTHGEDDLHFIDSLIERLPSLTSMTFTSSPPTHPEEAKQKHKAFHSTPQPNFLDLNVSSTLDDKVLFYIMRKFPSLKDIKLKDISNRPHSPLSSACIAQFMKYSAHMDSCFVELPCDNDVNMHYQLWSSIKTPFRFHITYKGARHQGTHVQIKKSKGEMHEINIIYSNSIEQHPHLMLIETIGRYLSHLNFTILNNYVPDDIMTAQFIENIFQNCTHLEHLTIHGASFNHCNSMETFIRSSKSLKKLSLVKCSISACFLPELLLRLPSLEQIELSHCIEYNPTDQAEVWYTHVPQGRLKKVSFEGDYNPKAVINIHLNHGLDERRGGESNTCAQFRRVIE